MASTLGYSGCDGSGAGLCLDDIAEYLSGGDIDTSLSGQQRVTTHTVGFKVDLPILRDTAARSGGRYFLADDVESLTKTMVSIIDDINNRSLSFAAPTVPVNTFNQTQNLNDVYITMFDAKTKTHWPGNLKKYRIQRNTLVDQHNRTAVNPNTGLFLDSAHSYWTEGDADGNSVQFGGAAQQLPEPSARNLYSNYASNDLTAANNAITTGNQLLQAADFGLTGANGEPELADLINWARGVDVRDEDNNPATTTRHAMGDALHSQPAAIVYGGTAEQPDTVIYTATNDGYLHAISGVDGQELWSFIPKQLLQNLRRLYFDPGAKFKHYGIDGNIVPVVRDVDGDGAIDPDDGDFVYLLFGMRRGGQTYFAIDVTNKNEPQVLWTFASNQSGESWSTPTVARVEIAGVSQNSEHAVVVIGGGYDTGHDTAAHPSTADASGAGIHILDLQSGTQLWRAGMDATADLRLDIVGREMDRAIPNRVRVIDLNTDGYADRMYASDLGGQIWRFDIHNGSPANALVTGGVIAQLGGDSIKSSPTPADTRRFYNAPDVSLITDTHQQRRYIAISIGSGYRAHPFDLSASDQFFSIRDANVFRQMTQDEYDNFEIIDSSMLIEVNGRTQAVVSAADSGWRFKLPANEKILADSLTFNDQIFFVSFSPDTAAATNCAAGKGTNHLYRVNVVNGDPAVANIESLEPWLADSQRRTRLQQGGIAPSPTILFPAPDARCTDAECSQAPLGCVGLECFDPGFDPFPVRTLWTQDGIE